jgi:predicted MFS family arabinose efflux permease
MRKVHPVWPLVFCAGTMLAINMGIRQTFGLYLKPISQDLDLERQVFSLTMGLLNLVWGISAPFAGALSDRFGAVRVAIAGAGCYIAGLVLMANAAGGNTLILSGALIGLGVSGTGFTAVFGVIARAAPPEQRTPALGMTTMGSAIGQFAFLPYAHALMDATGWKTSLLISAGTAALMVPLALSLARERGKPRAPASSGQALGAALAEAFKYPSFLLLTAGFFVCGFHIAAVATHFPAFLADRGFDAALGAQALMVVGIANILGTYLCGRLGGIMPKHIVLALLYTIRTALFLALIYLPLSRNGVLVYAFFFGMLWLGTIPLVSGLIVTFFGPKWLSTLYGIVFLSHQAGSFMGAWIGGWFFDTYRSYDMLWWAAALIGIAAAILHLPIKEGPARGINAAIAAAE